MSNVLRAAALPVSRWPNGAGRKADLQNGDGWTISYAWLDADAPFSLLTGMDRTITLVEGPGFTLDVAGHDLPVTTRFAPTCFDGGAVTTCRIAGPSRVLNVMSERARFRHSVTLLDRSGPVDPAGALACVAVLVDGAATMDGIGLERLDAVGLDGSIAVDLGHGGLVAVLRIE